MKTEIKKNFSNNSAYQIIFSSMILSLMALFELFVHFPGVFSGDKASIVATISGISTIIGVIGIIKRLNWGLYFLGFSIIFPVISMLFFDIGILCKFVEIFDLVVAIYLILVYKACNCEEGEVKNKLLRYSKIYFHLILIIILSCLLAIIFSVLSCAYESSKVRGAPGSIRWNDIRIQIKEITRVEKFSL